MFGSSVTAKSWTAIKTASRVKEEASWKRLLQRKLGHRVVGNFRVSFLFFGGLTFNPFWNTFWGCQNFEEMGMDLHQILRSLCYNTDWKYGVFWKLKHRTRMVLTWEDAYYESSDSYEPSGSKLCGKNLKQFDGGHLSHDPLGLAVAKMSYRVYSLGEGIVGEVAVTGKHRWICVDNHVASSGSSFDFEYSDGWQSQVAAGIRTIAVVSVAPLGVVQLGSLNKVIEDMEVVTHIRGLILGLQDYSLAFAPTSIQGSMKNSSCLPDPSMKNLVSETVPECLHYFDNAMKEENSDFCSPFPCFAKSFPDVHQKKGVDVVTKPGGPDLYSDECSILLQATSNNINLEHKKHVGMRLLNERKCADENNGCKNMEVGSEDNVTLLLHSSAMDNSNLYDLELSGQKVGVGYACFPSDFLDTAVSDSDKLYSVDLNSKGVSNGSRPSDMKFGQDMEKLEIQTESLYKNTSYTSLKFPAGCELHEALGPAFLKKSNSDWEAESQDVKMLERPDTISSSQLTSESRPEHLLEAIVGDVCYSNNDVSSEVSLCTSLRSPLASGRNPEISIHTVNTINSDGCSIDPSSLTREDKQPCLSLSGISGVMSPRGISSTCPSACSEQLEMSSEPAKNNKKRSRPGESSRPRPRDRQLIQDRIKELRELVPNGAKCSIDSLLEHTIKHMLFMQSISKHADKLNECAGSKIKLRHSGDITGSSNYEQGSSWAMEVGGHLKVHSILVENLNKNGQMLVEMLCEECSHFLEIAEAIKSLGLTILKGATEAHGEKTWICFVVEGQNSRIIHRLDILWPLVQILQSKSPM
ncbi:Transcription factor [Quillaja saponaria]|uniref:Transcription factor n=1 Tax=Quillaja saponaria TaxID=32244 RepID=A0AAD7Q997_QUISA|nr:Transcription factor [Quillaja saponaria]